MNEEPEKIDEISSPLGGMTYRDIDPIEAARERTATFVHNICMQPLLELQHRQDEISNAQARIKKSEEALVHYISEFATRCAEAEELATQIKPIIEEAVSPFRRDPPATLTQMNGGGK